MELLDSKEIEEVMEGLARAALQLVSLGQKLDSFNQMADITSSADFVAKTGAFRMSEGADRWLRVGQAAAAFRAAFGDDAISALVRLAPDAPEDADAVVPAEAGCPTCGERNTDLLTMNDDESVDCASCGNRYQLPSSGARKEDGDAG